MLKPATNKIIVICGPTVTGKSDYAVALSHTMKKSGIRAEILSADSRQVYRGMDLGTGKITKREMHGIPHHLLDIASPTRTVSVATFAKRGTKIIESLHKKNIVPIIVGGTGLYIDALVNKTIFPEVPPNPTLRTSLAKKTAPELYAELLKLVPTRAETIDSHNPVRLIRAIEIATILGHVPQLIHTSPYNVEWIGLDMDDATLRERIEKRLIKRLRAGMLAEVTHLHEQGVSWRRMHDLGLEYRYTALLLQKKITKAEYLEQLSGAIWHYAKRQRTWFKKNKKIRWINPLN